MEISASGYIGLWPCGYFVVLERPLNTQCIRNTYLEGSMNRSRSDTGDDDDSWGFIVTFTNFSAISAQPPVSFLCQ